MAIWQTAGKVRMTPKGVYSSSTAYEILDIVSNADQTISYIAKQAVPAGTALTNTTYWAVIADVTEALENADAAISYIGDSYSSSSTYAVGDYVIHDGGLYRCKTAISTAEAWNSAHWEQVSAMDEIQDVKDEVADLKSAFKSRYNGKKISIIGDSIDTYAGYIPAGYVTYYPSQSIPEITNVDQTWWKIVIGNSGATLEVNASWSGSRVTNTHPNTSFPDFYDRVPIVGSPDIVFVTLGTNDSNNNVALGEYDFTTPYENLSESTFRPAYIKGIKALQALYPNVSIVCITEYMSEGYRASIEYIAKELGAEYIDADDYIKAYTTHPGIKGMQQIASMVLFPTDEGLWQKHFPADSFSVGKLKKAIDEIEPGLSDAAKVALLNCFRHVAWIDDHGQDYYDALESALYADQYPKITALFNPGSNVIYTDDTLDSLKQYLTVKYFETEESAGTVIASNDYTLSGELTEGTNSITVSYNNIHTIVNISGVVDFYNIHDWSVTNGLLNIVQAAIINRTDGNVALSDVGTSQNRRAACATRGKHALINNYTSQETEWFAIPVPKNATRFTVGVQPATQFTGARFWKYNEATQLYESKQNVGWKQGEFTGDINTAGDDVIATISTKYDSAGSSYPALPTNIYISFE